MSDNTHIKTILLLAANPTDTSWLKLDEEARKIQEALKLAKKRDKFEIVTKWAVRVEDLRRALLDHEPNIVHFSGHGEGSEGLAFEDNFGVSQLVSSEPLASLFELFRSTVECVLLNACYSEIQAQAIHQHIDYVIGMNHPIGNVAAIEFATGFYDALGAGKSYEYAFSMGRASIRLKSSSEYSTPVLKFRPSSAAAKNSIESGDVEEKKLQPKYSGGISQSINDGTIYGGMQAVQGNNNQQTMNTVSTASAHEKQITQKEAIGLLAQIEQLIQKASELPDADKQNSLIFLQAAKALAQQEKPNKQLVAGNLKQMTDTLESASKTVVSTKNLWENIKPILIQLPTWLGVAKNFFGF